MAICIRNLEHAARLIGSDHGTLIYRFALGQDKLEQLWEKRFHDYFRSLEEQTFQQLKDFGRARLDDSTLDEMLFEHFYEVCWAAIKDSTKEERRVVDVNTRKQLSKPKPIRIPRSFSGLREMWDEYQRNGTVPKRHQVEADKIKKAYLDKCQDVWKKYSEFFRAGDAYDQELAKSKIQEAAKVGSGRAKTIVETETTNYYNDTKTRYYDQSDAVSHYLFLAIRDQATTIWCTDKVIDGKRGRHGLVYAKNDPLTKKETPACHWYCRSELVPLSIYNPRHLKLIEDLTIHRRNVICHALPPGWG